MLYILVLIFIVSVLGTRTQQMRSKLPDAVVSALIFLKCSDMSCVWHASTSTSTRPNCLLSHCKHETISRFEFLIQFETFFLVLDQKRRFMYDFQLHFSYSQILCSYLLNVLLLESEVLVLVVNVLVYSHSQLVYSKHLCCVLCSDA